MPRHILLLAVVGLAHGPAWAGEGSAKKAEHEKERSLEQRRVRPDPREEKALDKEFGPSTQSEFRKAIEEEEGASRRLRSKLFEPGPTSAPKPSTPGVFKDVSEHDRRSAAKEIAKYVARSSSVDLADLIRDPLIADHPWVKDAQWASLSAEKKVSMLVESAARVDRPQAEKVLAILARGLAQEYETVKHDLVLARYWKLMPRPPPVRFEVRPPAKPLIELTAAEVRAIGAIATYLSRGGQVTIDDVIREAELSSEAAERIPQGPSANVETTIETILALSARGEVRPVIERIAKLVARSYQTASFSPQLRGYLVTRDAAQGPQDTKVKRDFAATVRGQAAGPRPSPQSP